MILVLLFFRFILKENISLISFSCHFLLFLLTRKLITRFRALGNLATILSNYALREMLVSSPENDFLESLDKSPAINNDERFVGTQ